MTKDHGARGRGKPQEAAPTEYPHDRFDDVTRSGRVGAHRVTSQPRVARQFVIGGIVAAALLTAAGLLGVNFLNSIGKLPAMPELTAENDAPQTPKVRAELDPDATIVVLDGTSPTADIALRLAPIITDTNLGVISFAGPAAESDVELSAVFYKDPADEAAAKGLAKELGGLSPYFTDGYQDYDAQLIVLLGANYTGPGLSAE